MAGYSPVQQNNGHYSEDSSDQEDDTNFRRFQDGGSPNELLSRLSHLKEAAEQIANSPMSKQMQLGKELLSGMSPEDQQKMLQLGQDYLNRTNQGQNSQVPAEMQEFIRKQVEQDPEKWQSLLNGMNQQGSQPSDSGNSSPRNPTDSGQSTPSPTTGQSQNRALQNRPSQNFEPRPGTNSETGAGGNVEQFVPELSREFLEQLGGASNNSNGNSTQPPSIEDFLNSDFAAENLSDFNPDNIAGESESPAVELREANPNESIGNRFDRMVMDMANKTMSNSDNNFATKVTERMNGMFGGAMDRFHSRMNEKEWGTSGGRNSSIGNRIQNQLNSGGRRRNGIFSGGGEGNTSGPNLGSVQGINWLLMGGLALVFSGLVTFVVVRVLKAGEDDRPGVTGIFRRRFKLTKIRTAEQLIESLDRYLLATFGKPSSWWHSRRAEEALNSGCPALSPQIGELVDCYEKARYSKVDRTLSNAQIERCSDILTQVVNSHDPHESVASTEDQSEAPEGRSEDRQESE